MEARHIARDDRPPSHDPGSKYLGEEENKASLFAEMPPDERAEWESYSHLRVEAAFQDRVFVVFQPSGRGNNNIQRAPKVLTTVRVLSFVARDETGATVKLLNEGTNETMEIGHVPKKLFGYPVFVAIPPNFNLRWDVHRYASGTQRSLSYILFVKTRNKSSFFSTKNTYMETPNTMRSLYSHLDLKLDL